LSLVPLKLFFKNLLAPVLFDVNAINMKLKSAARRYTQTARAQSAEATAQRILDAFLERLMTDWFDEITLDRVAADAGVTVQTVLRRFDGKEGLLANAVKVLALQIRARRGAAAAGDIGSLVDGVIDDYEATGDAVIRLLALEPRHPALKEVLDFGRSEHRDWSSTAFGEALGKLNPAVRNRAIDALIVNTDVYTWKLLRRDMGRSGAETAATMKCLVEATIAEFTNPNRKR
jgi:AcrR family transcriptional regulator